MTTKNDCIISFCCLSSPWLDLEAIPVCVSVADIRTTVCILISAATSFLRFCPAQLDGSTSKTESTLVSFVMHWWESLIYGSLQSTVFPEIKRQVLCWVFTQPPVQVHTQSQTWHSVLLCDRSGSHMLLFMYSGLLTCQRSSITTAFRWGFIKRQIWSSYTSVEQIILQPRDLKNTWQALCSPFSLYKHLHLTNICTKLSYSSWLNLRRPII